MTDVRLTSTQPAETGSTEVCRARRECGEIRPFP